MFDEKPLRDYWEPPVTAASASLLGQLVTAGRAENQAAARRLALAGQFFEHRREQRGEEADWAVDTWAAVGAEVAAALHVSLGKAGSLMHYGLAMRRLPAVAALFSAGDLDLAMFRTIVYHTEWIIDESIQAYVDQAVAAYAKRWQSMTLGRLGREVDAIVAAVDPDAVRRVKERVCDRDVTVWHGGDGIADLSGRLMTTDAQALDKRLDALAATVCADDPRYTGQRRADALGALAAGAERLMCRCGQPECPATAATPSPVVIHVVAEQTTLDGHDDKPGYVLGSGSLISADLLREVAQQARQRPLMTNDLTAEPGYRPSRALAEFVRARDLTCRAPGCDRPAADCQLDHTVPHSAGGATQASNIKCLCVFHHLLKTFWGWRDCQLSDGTVVWTLPNGQTYVTTPGSALLFPALTNAVTTPAEEPTGDRTAMMPRRRRTRAQNRAHRIATERSHNRRIREAASANAPGVNDAGAQRLWHPDDDPPF